MKFITIAIFALTSLTSQFVLAEQPWVEYPKCVSEILTQKSPVYQKFVARTAETTFQKLTGKEVYGTYGDLLLDRAVMLKAPSFSQVIKDCMNKSFPLEALKKDLNGGINSNGVTDFSILTLSVIQYVRPEPIAGGYIRDHFAALLKKNIPVDPALRDKLLPTIEEYVVYTIVFNLTQNFLETDSDYGPLYLIYLDQFAAEVSVVDVY